MHRPLIVLCPQASPVIGGGHAMRCLSVGRALAGSGAQVVIAADEEALFTVPALAASGFEVRRPLPFPCDAVLLDGYGFALEDERAWRGVVGVLAAFEDAPRRVRELDLVIDSSPLRIAGDYAGLVPATAALLLGTAHAPVSEAFLALRDMTLGRRRKECGVSRALVSFGLTDPMGLCVPAAQALLAQQTFTRVDIAVGTSAPGLAALKALAAREPRIVLHIDTPAMAQLTAAADIGLGAGGGASWERCALGLASIVMAVADNQADNIEALRRAEAAVIVESPDAFGAAIRRLVDDSPLRTHLSANAAVLCDGGGARRIAEAILDRVSARDQA